MESYQDFITYIKEKIVHPGVRKHSQNLGWMFFGRIASMVVTFLTTAYIARNLGPANYGELSYAISFVGLFAFIASLGIEQVLYRDLIQHPEKRSEYLGSAVGIRIVASLITMVVCVFSAFIFSEKDVSLFLIFIISLSFLLGTFQLFAYELQADTKSKYPSIFSLIIISILNIFKILVIFFDKGVIYLAIIVLLEPIFYSLMYLYLKHKTYGNLTTLTFNKNIAFSILKDSFPLIFASAFYFIYARIDQVMLKNMIDAEAVGLYDSAVRISEISYFVPNIVLSALFPAIMNAKKTSNELYYKRTKKLLLAIFLISSLIAIVTTLLSEQLLMIIFGIGFIGALPVLQIYAWSNIGAALNALAQQLLLAENLTKNISIGAFLGMVTNIILNILLIPIYGISGAALATLISYMIPFLSLLLFKKTRILLLTILKI